MSRLYPALDVARPSGLDDDRLGQLLAVIDDESPIAVEDRGASHRFFFPSPLARCRAAARLAAFDPNLECAAIDVPDEDWAARSQASVTAVRVGRLVIAPPWAADENEPGVPGVTISIVIQPSMGFGTGHHASTRLCLHLLQQLPVVDQTVLDVGTGSGVLALAAAKLGAARVVAIDNDEDALASARENVDRNSAGAVIALTLTDVATGLSGDRFDLVLANLTGPTLERLAGQLAAVVRPGGALVTSGYGPDEEQAVVHAFTAVGMTAAARAQEDEWVAMALVPSPSPHRPQRA